MAQTIQIVSDIVCPWCYVGKRRLERALDALALRESVRTVWLPFELNPDLPPGGMARAEYRTRKFGPDRWAAMDARMAETGREEGIAFAFDRMERQPNTRPAHVLIAHATEQGRGDVTVEALFRGFFEEAWDVGDEAVLLAIAEAVGLDRDGAAAALRSEERAAEIVGFERQAQAAGIAGVPYFIVDGQWSLSGAQPTEAWVEALRANLPAAA